MRATTKYVMAAIGGLLGWWLRGPEQHDERDLLLSLATYSAEKNALGLHDKAGYSTWLPTIFADGQRAMIVAYPLVYDTPQYHAAAYRYYRGAVLPVIAEDYGESNLEAMHDVLARMFLPPALVPKRRGRGLQVRRKSTSMESLTCEQFCDFIDRVIAWAICDRGLIVPMADPAWKWKQEQRRGAGSESGRLSSSVVGVAGDRDGAEPSAAPSGGQ